MAPGAVLGGRQLLPGEVVARKSPAVASRRQLGRFFLTCITTCCQARLSDRSYVLIVLNCFR
ncbi:hypothetical protein A2U01_0083026, partial [Trifolium medium]|nr:hypothetical protein [Trifolium medium]